jgi:hypothetical protein
MQSIDNACLFPQLAPEHPTKTREEARAEEARRIELLVISKRREQEKKKKSTRGRLF